MDELNAQTVLALEELTRVCLAMDLERQDDRPTEDEYQKAMAQAQQVLARRKGGNTGPLKRYVWNPTGLVPNQNCGDWVKLSDAQAVIEHLAGEKQLLQRLLREANQVLSTLEGEDQEEASLLAGLRKSIAGAVGHRE